MHSPARRETFARHAKGAAQKVIGNSNVLDRCLVELADGLEPEDALRHSRLLDMASQMNRLAAAINVELEHFLPPATAERTAA